MTDKQPQALENVALSGNPNVGKSTVFNALTGMNQHTGNWPGVTVQSAQGVLKTKKGSFRLIDLPGTYSLAAASPEEEVARDFLCFSEYRAAIVVCDATCLSRSLHLALQIMEMGKKVVILLNMMDEAEKKNITLHLDQLKAGLHVPVVGVTAKKKKTLAPLLDALDQLDEQKPYIIRYPTVIEQALAYLAPACEDFAKGRLNARWLALQLIEGDERLLQKLEEIVGAKVREHKALTAALLRARKLLCQSGIGQARFKDTVAQALINSAESACHGVVETKNETANAMRIDHILTGRVSAFPVMLILLAFVFWLTIIGANYPSDLLRQGFDFIEQKLTELFSLLGAPSWLHGVLVLGVYRTLAFVVSVMLPPMAIFFPMFTLLEDSGYLPRIAYNLDRPFCRCGACGKQALTMCMGFGCNAAGVIGCRIINSPREKLLAILTNNLVPCNGRFPTLILLITLFFVGAESAVSGLVCALVLTLLIVFSVLMTFLATRFLSATLLKGVSSSFTLELPPYRRPQFVKVLGRSLLDRTLYVLGRAVTVAAPAGLILYLLANITVADASLLTHCAAFLDPFARLFGLDGVIMIAFILGFPANEIVLPIILMAYSASGLLMPLGEAAALKEMLVQNGWTVMTAVSVMLFSLLHFPCSTTLITIKKETGSAKWTLVAFLLPTLMGLLVCFIINAVYRLLI